MGRVFLKICSNVGSFLILVAGCRGLERSSENDNYAVTAEVRFEEPQGTTLEVQSDKLFRRLFAWHLAREGLSPGAVQESVYMTPERFLKSPVTENSKEFFDTLHKELSQEKASDWYLQGIKTPLVPLVPKTPAKPATIVVIPGIFGEFINNYPFHEVVTNQNSIYHRTWQPKIAKIEDKVFSLALLKEKPMFLGDLLKIGSYDLQGRPWVQVVVLEAKSGSLETLGTLESVMDVYKRRLEKFFKVVTDDSDVYFMGYSRGTPVALELIRQLALEPQLFPWARRIKGMIGLGGVFYGTKVADEALNSQSTTSQGKMFAVLRDLVAKLKVDEDILAGKKSPNAISYAADNTRYWAKALKELIALQLGGGKNRELLQAGEPDYNLERKLRKEVEHNHKVDFLGLLGLVKDFAFELLERQCDLACYFTNVKTFKLLMTRVFEGVESLSVTSRLKWWQVHRLPEDLRMLSIVGSMPDATRSSKLTPLFQNPNYGAKMVDFNEILRGSFYQVLLAEKTELNDSQVTYARARYWPTAFKEHRHKHYFLGVMGTHHWGFSFPFAIKNRGQISNPFGRSALIAAVGSFIEEIRQEP